MFTVSANKFLAMPMLKLQWHNIRNKLRSYGLVKNVCFTDTQTVRTLLVQYMNFNYLLNDPHTITPVTGLHRTHVW